MIIRNPLTVKELMERLEKADPALPVYIETEAGYHREARFAGESELEMLDSNDNHLLDSNGEYVYRDVFSICY